jgi:hypothetical protein
MMLAADRNVNPRSTMACVSKDLATKKDLDTKKSRAQESPA